jgi:hypothetical protein
MLCFGSGANKKGMFPARTKTHIKSHQFAQKGSFDKPLPPSRSPDVNSQKAQPFHDASYTPTELINKCMIPLS